MHQGQALFVLQNELIDKKMEAMMITGLAASRHEIRDEFKADIAKLTALIKENLNDFKTEMRGMQREMQDIRHELHRFGLRLNTVESVLGVMQQRQNEIRTRLLDYTFKAGWIVVFSILAGFSSFFAAYLHTLIK